MHPTTKEQQRIKDLSVGKVLLEMFWDLLLDLQSLVGLLPPSIRRATLGHNEAPQRKTEKPLSMEKFWASNASQRHDSNRCLQNETFKCHRHATRGQQKLLA